METHLSDMSDGRLPSADVIREALCDVLGQLSDLPDVSGFAPSQWSLKAAAVPASLSDRTFNAAEQSHALGSEFLEAQE